AGALGASGGDLQAAVNGGITGGLFGLAGTVGVASNSIERYFAHAAAGCASAAIGGADCDQGASAALAGKFVTNNTPQSLGGSEGFVAASVAGGTASVLTGGKFGNGAYTAAYGYLYNQALSRAASGANLLRGATGARACQSAECQLGVVDQQASAAMQMSKTWNRFWGGVQNLIFNQPPEIPSGWDGTTPPADGWEWRGPDAPGGNRGAWVAPSGGRGRESLHPDFNHGAPIGPHVDWNGPKGERKRIFPDGRVEDKK
ncbi:MAG: hypothetical protein DCE87_15250, partial [Betaproteobacteria bacterium]